MGGDAELTGRALATGRRLQQRGLRLAAAESCTGGWIAKILTDSPGSSDWFECGFVTYSNDAKQRQLGVAAATLRDHGAVSEQTVREMARGALSHSAAQVAVAVSGVAGPGGGGADKPVGTVWLAWAVAPPSGADAPGADAPGADAPVDVTTRRCRFDGDRDAVRRRAVGAAFDGLDALLENA